MPKRLLILCHVFPPSVGGIERATVALAWMTAQRGWAVTVVTATPGTWTGEASEPFTVVRRPSVRTLIALVTGADAVIVNNPVLRLQWPLLFVPRPHLTVLHSPFERGTAQLRLATAVKLRVLRRSARVVAVSAAFAADLPMPAVVIPNVVDLELFQAASRSAREPGTVVFVGRLTRQKGVDLLIGAIAFLRQQGVDADLLVIGDGAERPDLEQVAAESGLADRVRFAGALEGDELVRALGTRQVLAVPSRGREPFGIVALEGIAAGCAVVVTDSGGLPEAVGACGLVVPSEDVSALAAALRLLLTDAALRARLRAGADAHLQRHSMATVGAAFDHLLTDAVSAARRAVTA